MTTIRSPAPDECAAIIEVVREAFTSLGHDGQQEVDIVENTWRLDAGIDGLELVAFDNDAVVGYVLGARGDLEDHEVVAVAPLCVAPSHQDKGIGTVLMRELIQRADTQGWALVAVLGDPGYYQRFGFEPSGRLDIVYRPVGAHDPHFQVRRLTAYDPSLRGEFRYCWEPEDR